MKSTLLLSGCCNVRNGSQCQRFWTSEKQATIIYLVQTKSIEGGNTIVGVPHWVIWESSTSGEGEVELVGWWVGWLN